MKLLALVILVADAGVVLRRVAGRRRKNLDNAPLLRNNRLLRDNSCPLEWTEDWTVGFGAQLKNVFETDFSRTKYARSFDPCIFDLGQPICMRSSARR